MLGLKCRLNHVKDLYILVIVYAPRSLLLNGFGLGLSGVDYLANGLPNGIRLILAQLSNFGLHLYIWKRYGSSQAYFSNRGVRSFCGILVSGVDSR